MTPEQINLIITTVLDLLKVALGALIGVWITSFTLKSAERKKVRKELGKPSAVTQNRPLKVT